MSLYRVIFIISTVFQKKYIIQFLIHPKYVFNAEIFIHDFHPVNIQLGDDDQTFNGFI